MCVIRVNHQRVFHPLTTFLRKRYVFEIVGSNKRIERRRSPSAYLRKHQRSTWLRRRQKRESGCEGGKPFCDFLSKLVLLGKRATAQDMSRDRVDPWQPFGLDHNRVVLILKIKLRNLCNYFGVRSSTNEATRAYSMVRAMARTPCIVEMCVGRPHLRPDRTTVRSCALRRHTPRTRYGPRASNRPRTCRGTLVPLRTRPRSP